MSGRKHSLRKSCQAWTTPISQYSAHKRNAVIVSDQARGEADNKSFYTNLRNYQIGAIWPEWGPVGWRCAQGPPSAGGLPRYRWAMDAIEPTRALL